MIYTLPGAVPASSFFSGSIFQSRHEPEAVSARRTRAVTRWFWSSDRGNRRRRGGNVEIAPGAISKGRWETWETAVWLSTFSMAPAFPPRFLTPPPGTLPSITVFMGWPHPAVAAVLVRQLRGPHLSRCPWWSNRSNMAPTAAASPSSLPQSSTGRLEVSSVLARS
jgi:hypothetical protein